MKDLVLKAVSQLNLLSFGDTVTVAFSGGADSVALLHVLYTLKDELGITPVAYLWHSRLVIAKKLLEFTNLPVKEIAKRCGFKTVQHFSRKFEEQLGLSPAVFRMQAIARRKASF